MISRFEKISILSKTIKPMKNKLDDYPKLYDTIMNFRNHAEAISWNRFNNYLVFNSIIILAWVTLSCSIINDELILSSLCFLGIVSGFFWSTLGVRTRKVIDYLGKLLKEIEKESNEKIKPITMVDNNKEIMQDYLKLGTSYNIVAFGPMLVSAIQLIFLFNSLEPNNPCVRSIIITSLGFSILIHSITPRMCFKKMGNK